MPEIIDNNTAANNAGSADTNKVELGGGEQGQQTGAGLSQTRVNNVMQFDTAFGFKTINTRASQLCAVLDEAKKQNASLGAFYFGTWDAVDMDKGSMAWVAGEYNGALLYGALLFENGDSFRVTTNGQTESYYTVAGLFGKEAVDNITKTVESRVPAHYAGNVHFMGLNVVPELPTRTNMDPAWAMHLLGQQMLTIFGRAKGFLGTMKLGQNDRFTASVMGGNGVQHVLDINGHAHRADFQLNVSHMPVAANNDLAPTLTGSAAQVGYPQVAAGGYINLRYIGLRQQAATVGQVANLQQLQPEVVATILDSQQQGGSSSTPIQRQLVALAGFCALAADGGWRDLAVRSFDRENRKVSALAAHMSWLQTNVDVKALDSSVEAVTGFVDNFCLPTAAVMLYHRAGNGIAGLTTMLAEIALGSTEAIRQLLLLLDEMFPKVGLEGDNFSRFFVRRLQADPAGHAAEITSRDIIVAAVPTISGVYQGSGGLLSFQDADLVRVANYFGDKAGEMMDFIRAQSYGHRNLDEKAQRIYLLKLMNAMFGAGKPKATGEALEMALNPVFGKALLDAVRMVGTRLDVVGVSAYNHMNNSLFTNGQSYTLAGNGGMGSLSDFSLSGVTGGAFTF